MWAIDSKLSNIWLSFAMKSADLIESAEVELFHDLVHSFHNLKKLGVTCRDFHTEKRPAEDEASEWETEIWLISYK